jgi:hypothetical protein
MSLPIFGDIMSDEQRNSGEDNQLLFSFLTRQSSLRRQKGRFLMNLAYIGIVAERSC